MNWKTTIVPVLLLAGASLANTAFDTSVTPDFYPGDGIGNNHFTVDVNGTVETGMKAHGRYEFTESNVDNVYFVPVGTDWFAGGGYDVARWNYDTHVNLDTAGATFDPQTGIATGGSRNFADTIVRLYLDFDPAPGTPDAERGIMNLSVLVPSTLGVPASDISGVQGSENLAFAYLQNPAVYEQAPSVSPASFDPTVMGSYELSLEARDASTGDLLSRTDITVQVVPEPLTVMGVFVGICGLARYARRRSRVFS